MNKVKMMAGVLTLGAFAVSSVHAGVIVNDSFDDGDIAVNTLGTGTGFNSGGNLGGGVSEAGGDAVVVNPTNGGRRGYLTSKEGGAVNTADTTRFEFNGVDLSQNAANTGTGGTGRLYFGVQGDNNSAGDRQNNPLTGLYIQLEANSVVTQTDGWTGTSALFFEAGDDTRTQLATWSFDTLDLTQGSSSVFLSGLSFTFDLTDDSYAVSIGGDTMSNVTGSLSGSLTHGMSTGYAAMFSQTEGPGIDTSIGQVVITEAIPEPATLGLLAVFGGGVLFIRRRFMI